MGFRVKPLRWYEFGRGGGRWRAITPVADYVIWKNRGVWNASLWEFEKAGPLLAQGVDTREQAEMACDSHYRTLVAELLEETA